MKLYVVDSKLNGAFSGAWKIRRSRGPLWLWIGLWLLNLSSFDDIVVAPLGLSNSINHLRLWFGWWFSHISAYFERRCVWIFFVVFLDLTEFDLTSNPTFSGWCNLICIKLSLCCRWIAKSPSFFCLALLWRCRSFLPSLFCQIFASNLFLLKSETQRLINCW